MALPFFNEDNCNIHHLFVGKDQACSKASLRLDSVGLDRSTVASDWLPLTYIQTHEVKALLQERRKRDYITLRVESGLVSWAVGPYVSFPLLQLLWTWEYYLGWDPTRFWGADHLLSVGWLIWYRTICCWKGEYLSIVFLISMPQGPNTFKL